MVAESADPLSPDPRVEISPPPDLLPPGYPSGWAADVVLRDGGTCHLRPIIPADRDALQAMHLAQSDRSRYLRFFAPLPRLSERDLDRFTTVDYTLRVALIAIVKDRIVGVGRYDVIDPGEAEVAFNIADSQQGRGLGSVLLEHLAQAARERAVTRFVAEVLPENRKMVRVFADAGYEVTHHFDDGVISLEFDIEPTTKSMTVSASRERRAESASLRALMQASSVAVIGAGEDPSSLGHIVVQNILDSGFQGTVHPVHPSASEVCGLPVRPSITSIGEQVDLAVLAVGAEHVLKIAGECGLAGVRGLVVITDGFTGVEGALLEQRLTAMSRAAGMRVIGPASLGLVNTNPEVSLNASVLPLKMHPGGLSLFSQSAGLGLVLLAEALDRNLGIASAVSAGDRADVSGNDLLQYWAEDDRTKVVAMYTESSGNPRKFSRIARAVARTKPVVMVRSWTSSLASRSTTGRSSDAPREAFNAMLRQAGVIRADNIHHLIQVVHLLTGQPLPQGRRVRVVSNSTTLAALVEEACASWGLTCAESIYLRSLSPLTLREGIAEAADDLTVTSDSIVVALVPRLAGFGDDLLDVIETEGGAQTKTILSILVGYSVLQKGTKSALGPVPVYATPEDAVRALASVTNYAQWRQRDWGQPVEPSGCRVEEARDFVEGLLAAHPDGLTLSAEQTRWLLDLYGISVVPNELVATVEEAVVTAARLGYPVALKYANQVLRERRDVTGARLGIDDEEELLADLEEMLELDDPAVSDGFLVQPMVASGVAVELTTVEDPLYGPILSFGFAGDAIDLLGDVAYRIPPLTEGDVAELVREVKASPRLFGYGGSAPLNVSALESLIARVATLSEDLPEIARLEMTPVLVSMVGVNPLFARISLAKPPSRVDTGLVRRL